MNLLAVDTSTPTGGVAVVQNDRVVAAIQVTSKKTHARRVMSAIDTALHMALMDVGQLDGYVVTVGPGSFTGLRIGISAVKGLGFATNKPAAGVSTLEVLAYPFAWFPHLVCPMLDARKEQVYSALYQWGGNGPSEKIAPECVVDPAGWLDTIDGQCLFVGDGAMLYRRLIEDKLGGRAMFAPPCLNTLQVAVVAEIGLKEFEKGNGVDVAHLAPRYIRSSDAEINLEAGRLIDK
jgi:tRNA threonylcarbamoyladenosine biosynthesis protein TsaB